MRACCNLIFFLLITLLPAAAQPSESVADSLIASGNLEAALNAIDTESNPGAEAFRNKAFIYARLGDFDNAYRMAELHDRLITEPEGKIAGEIAEMAEARAARALYELTELKLPYTPEPGICKVGDSFLLAFSLPDSAGFPMTGNFTYRVPKMFLWNPATGDLQKIARQKDFVGYLPGSYDSTAGILYYTRFKILPDGAVKSQIESARWVNNALNDKKKLTPVRLKAMHPHIAPAAAGNRLFFTIISAELGNRIIASATLRKRKPRAVAALFSENNNTDATSPVYAGERLYFSSSKKPTAGGYDVYSVALPPENEKPVRVGYPISDGYDNVFFHPPTGNEPGLVMKKINGSYRLYEAKHKSTENIRSKTADCTAVLYYATGSYALTATHIPELEKILYEYKKTENAVIIIEGHTDAAGTDAGNERLSYLRAGEAVTYFNSRGVPLNRMQPQSYGAAQPAEGTGLFAGENSLNRRVVLRVTRRHVSVEE